MHNSLHVRMEYLLHHYQKLWAKENSVCIKVLDIGSYNQNGTYRDLLCDDRINYTGLDMSMGPNVDLFSEIFMRGLNWKIIRMI